MSKLLLLIGPTLMIYLGLHIMNSVPLTFLLFYGWLFAVPCTEMFLLKRFTFAEAVRHVGFALNRKNLYYGIVSGIIFFLTILAAGSLFLNDLFDQNDLHDLLAAWNFSGDLLGWLVFVLVVINPFLEEIYWRGYFFYKLEKNETPTKMIMLTSFCYSLYHLLSVIPLFNGYTSVFVIIAVFLAGVIWGYLRYKTRSLVGSIVSHILADSGIILLYLVFLK